MNNSENYKKAIEVVEDIKIGQKFKKQMGKNSFKECFVFDIIVPFSVKNNDFMPFATVYAQFEENTFSTASFEVAVSTIKRGQ